MSRHSPDTKATALKRMQPPMNDSIALIPYCQTSCLPLD